MLQEAHALEAGRVLGQLQVDLQHGLSTAGADERRAREGPNVLPRVRSRSLLRALADQFTNIIAVLLGAAAAISWLTGDVIDAAAIAAVLLLNGAIGFGMEWQANRAIEALRQQTRIGARVRRNGTTVIVPAEELVTGDIVVLEAGDRVPADLRVLEGVSLRAEEAPLTGESKSVFKSAESVALDSAIAERSSMLFLGTVVTAGRALAVVVATGEHTELGRIGKLVSEAPQEMTPLQKKLNRLGRQLAYIVIVIGAMVAFAGWVRGDGLWMMVEVGISLAVAAVPEALPAVTTFILAFGVAAMARRHAIVRRLGAVETLGSTTVICSDKTGTLTMNRMTVTEIDTRDRQRLLRAIALCNDATLSTGDPTEIALARVAVEEGVDLDALRREFPRVGEHPFDAQSKRMITIHEGGLWVMKGAPSVVIAASRLTDEERRDILERNAALASKGLRILAVAEKRAPAHASPGQDFEFLGLTGMLDPPRPGVLEAVQTARTAGIRLIMLTGDQEGTARSIARDLRLGDGEPRVLHARELLRADAIDLVESADVFARVSPEDKYRIVEALQNAGEIVAVTGDGVNDAPALKKADVGVAMGERGTEVAKEAADIVLADDNFATIVAAVEGGRAIYANIIKFVHMLFSHNLAEVLTVFVAILIGYPVPLLPLQILWINIVTDVFPAFALALEPAPPRIMEHPPRRPGESLLSRPFFFLITWQAMVLAAIALSAYAWALRTDGVAGARTMALLAVVGVQIGQTFNCRSRTHSAFEGVLRNPHIWYASATVIALQILAVTFTPLREILKLEKPSPAQWLVFALTIALPVAIVEVQKALTRRSGPSLPHAPQLR